MYIEHCRLTRFQQLRLMEYFVAGTPARTAADLVSVHRNSAIRFFHKLRRAIASKQQNRAPQFSGKIEVDENYCGGTRKEKRGLCWKSDSIWPSKARWESLYAAGNQRKGRYAITCNPAVC